MPVQVFSWFVNHLPKILFRVAVHLSQIVYIIPFACHVYFCDDLLILSFSNVGKWARARKKDNYQSCELLYSI